MGFECGFDTVVKYKDTTYEELFNIESYISWKGNKWNFEINENSGKAPYPTYKDYWTSFVNTFENDKFPGIPDQDKVKYYSNNKQGEYGGVAKTLGFWCSSGRSFDDFVCTQLCDKKIDSDGYYYRVDKEFINKSLEWLSDQLDTYKLIPVTVTKSFKEVDTDSVDDADILLTSCDGIEVEDEDGNVRRIYCSSSLDWGEPIFVGTRGFDVDLDYAYKGIRDTLVELLTLDLDDNLVWYWRSF